MSIKGNNTSGLISVNATDTVILNNSSAGRWAVGSISLHEYGGTGDTVELFKSSDATSTAAERIDKMVLAADATTSSAFIPFVLSPNEQLLAKATTGTLVNIEAVYIAYSGGS